MDNDPKRYISVKKWKDGGEQVFEYFETKQDAVDWIKLQPQPGKDEFQWCVGEY